MRLLTRVRQESDGFTLIEAMVSLVIIFGLMVVLLRTFDTGTRVIVESRRQATASAFASELIERGQALEWGHMGLATSTRGSACATEQVGCYIGDPFTGGDLAYDAIEDEYLFGGEKVVFSNADTFRPFLNFYERVQKDDSEFDRYLFVTSIEDPATNEEVARRLTAIVQWVPPNGFRKEVRLETIVAEYQEPSQPLISGTVRMTGGALELGSSASGLYGGAYAHGTDWDVWKDISGVDLSLVSPLGEYYWDPTNERDQFTAAVNFPTVTVNATSDFVSSTNIAVSGTEASFLRWEATDGLFLTADDLITSIAANGSSFASDDDASTVDDIVYGPASPFPGGVLNEPIAALAYVGPGLQDLAITESSPYEIDGWLFTKDADLVRGLPADDEYPFAELTDTSEFASEISVGFTDYTEDWVRNVNYGPIPVLGTLSEPQYDFDLFRRDNPASAASAIVLGATVDRSSATAFGYRQITADLSQYDGGRLYFLDDDAFPRQGKSSFQGWVRITMPDISVSLLAGEGVLAAPATVIGDLVIEQWDPTVGPWGGYVVVNPDPTAGNVPVDYGGTFGSDCETGTNVEESVVLWDDQPGGVITTSISDPGSPFLEYAVSGTVTIKGWCTRSSDPDGLGNRPRTWFETKLPIVTVDLDYQVIDYSLSLYTAPTDLKYPQDLGQILLYDIGLHYESEKLFVNAVYIDPNAD